jgi:hypothetical protein
MSKTKTKNINATVLYSEIYNIRMVIKYPCKYRKFQNWCNLHNFISLPASTTTVAIYLNSLVQRSVSVSVLYSNSHVFQITMIFPVHVNNFIKYIWSNRIFLYNWFAQSTFSTFQKHRNKFIIIRVRM